MSVLVLGDIHFPFHHVAALKKAKQAIAQVRPQVVIQIGDLRDMYSASKYPRSYDLMTPAQENKLGREQSEEMWHHIKKLSPRSKRIQLMGNHDTRYTSRVYEKLPEAEVPMKQWLRNEYTFDGVETIHDPKEEIKVEGIIYQHGYRPGLGDHATYNQHSTVVGHSHRAGLKVFHNLRGLFFELNVGWLGDRDAKVFGYRAQNKITHTSRGFGIVDSLGPRFIPLE